MGSRRFSAAALLASPGAVDAKAVSGAQAWAPPPPIRIGAPSPGAAPPQLFVLQRGAASPGKQATMATGSPVPLPRPPSKGPGALARRQSVRSLGSKAASGGRGGGRGALAWCRDTPACPHARGPCHRAYKLLSLTDSILGQAFAWLILVAIVTSIVVMCVESTREVREFRIRGGDIPSLSVLEAVAVVLFTVEFVGRLLSVSSAPLSDQYSADLFGDGDDDEGQEEDGEANDSRSDGGDDRSGPAVMTSGTKGDEPSGGPADGAAPAAEAGPGGGAPAASPVSGRARSRSIDGFNDCLAEARRIDGTDDDDYGDDDADEWEDLGVKMSAESIEDQYHARVRAASSDEERARARAQFLKRLSQRGMSGTWCCACCAAAQRSACAWCLLPPCATGCGRSVWRTCGSPRARLKLWVFLTTAMNLIDFAAIAPFYVEAIVVASNNGGPSDSGVALSVLRVLRVARVLRVLKLGRRSSGVAIIAKSLAKSAYALFLTFFFVILGIVLFGAIMFYAESGEYDPDTGLWMRPDVTGTGRQESPFSSIMAAFWFW